MPPQAGSAAWVLNENDAATEDKAAAEAVPPSAEKREWKIVWRNVILFALLHLGGVYGAFLFLFKAKWATVFFSKFFFFICYFFIGR